MKLLNFKSPTKRLLHGDYVLVFKVTIKPNVLYTELKSLKQVNLKYQLINKMK